MLTAKLEKNDRENTNRDGGGCAEKGVWEVMRKNSIKKQRIRRTDSALLKIN